MNIIKIKNTLNTVDLMSNMKIMNIMNTMVSMAMACAGLALALFLQKYYHKIAKQIKKFIKCNVYLIVVKCVPALFAKSENINIDTSNWF